MNQKGVTLIELLGVIALIGLLASVVIVALNNERVAARNARRLADIQQLSTAINSALSVQGASLPVPGNGFCLSVSCYGGWSFIISSAALNTMLAPYLANLPTDPADTTRGAGGYAIFYFPNNPPAETCASAPGQAYGSWNSNCFIPGFYLDWLMEPPYTPATCGAAGPAGVWHTTGTGTECLLLLN